MRSTRIGVALTAIACLAIAAGCASKTGSSPTPVKVDQVFLGNVTDLSGVQQTLGQADSNGGQIAIDQINAAGGIKSLGGAKLVVNKYDTKSSPDNAVSEATKAVNDKVTAIWGGEISDTVIAGSNVTHRAGISWITTGGTAAQITARGMNDMFQMVPSTDQSAQNYYKLMAYVAGKLGLTNPTMAIAVSDTTYGNNLDAGFSKISPNMFNVVDKVSYPLSTTDLSSIAARLVAKNPDAIFNEGYPADGLQLGTLFSSKFTTTAKIFFCLANEPTVVSQLGTKANGMLLGSSLSATVKGVPPAFNTFVDAYKAKFNAAPVQQAIWGYEAVMMIAAALEKAGSVDPAKVADALHQASLDHNNGNLYPQDKLAFDAQGRITDAPAFFTQIQDGKAVLIFPADSATAQPIAYRS